MTSGIEPNVLIIDDDQDMNVLMSEILRLEGMRVASAANGKHALYSLEHGLLPDAIVTDLEMSPINGWELITLLKNNERYKDIPIITASGRILQTNSIAKNVFAQFTKPFTASTFVAAVKDAIALSQQHKYGDTIVVNLIQDID